MNHAQALKIIKQGLKPTMTRLAVGANLYEMGQVELWTQRDYEQRQTLLNAISVLETAAPIQLSLLQEAL